MRYVTLASGRRRRWLWFIALQLGIVLVAVGAYLYRAYLDTLPGDGARSMCLLHDFVHLYCPGCGGTRAVVALLRGQIVHSLLCNPLSAYLVVGFLVVDVRALLHIIGKQPFEIRIPSWYLWVMLILAILHCVVRNVLMISSGYDYLGDLVRFWHV